jgi:uroporphyrinogen decarboxylase
MNKIERVNAALMHKQPDKTPVSLGTIIVDGMTRYALKNYEEFKEKSVSDPVVTSRAMQTAVIPEWILDDLDSEFRPVRMIEAFTDNTVYSDDGFTDGYGLFWKKSEMYFDPYKGPWEGNVKLEDIKNNPWINAYLPEKVAGMKKRCKALKEAGYIVVADMMTFGPFEHAIWMRGYENFLCDFYTNPDLAEAILDKTTQGGIELFDALLTEVGDYIDIVCHGDDMGMQDRSLFSPEIYDKFIKKCHKKQIDFIKTKTNAKVLFHSCGSVFGLIPGLIEAGVDILNPIQTTSKNMDPENLKNSFGSELTFWGGIDTQSLLENGTKQEMRDEIIRLVDVLGKDGGYILAPAHNLQRSVPAENIQFMFDCLKEFR